MVKINIQNKDPEVMDVYIKMSIPITNVFEFLMKRGYHIKTYTIDYPPVEEFLIYEPASSLVTFTATKPHEAQSSDHIYHKVFEKELKSILNQI